MKHRKKDILFITILLAAIFAMVLYSSASDSFRIESGQREPLPLNQSEIKFTTDKKEVVISVEERLEYLNPGFLQEYLSSVIEPSGLKVKLTKAGADNADASIIVVDDAYRKNIDKINFTAPLFQVTGSLFIHTEANLEKVQLAGVCVKGQFTDDEMKTLSYDGKAIDLIETESVKEAVTVAGEKNLDCILGDQVAIVDALNDQGLEDQYADMYANFYDLNVCIAVRQADAALYSVLNQCVHSADRRMLIGRAQEHWFGISDSFVKEDRYKDAAALLIIVFAAVFCAFFFYYQSNKNLYNELTDRMKQLVASKQEMQTTFNGVSYYMAELAPDGTILDINKAFLNYVERESMGRLISEALELPEELQAELEGMLEKTRTTGTGTLKEIILRNHILEVNIFPIASVKGDVEKLLFMASDVTRERMAERQMLQDNKMIAVGQLAAGVAHEIRNPLGVIRNYCYVLKNMKDETAQDQVVEVIEKSVDTAGTIIDNLLNFSRIGSKEVEEVFIKEHVNSVISINRGMLKKKQITISVQCPEDFKVRMAVESFDMILINLVSNAVDAIEEQGRLSIDIYRTKDKFYVKVADTGTGIEKEIMEDIFHPFFTTKSTTEGNGLGLYIVYNEIKKMDGEIKVESEVGAGTTFRVILPVRTEDSIE